MKVKGCRLIPDESLRKLLGLEPTHDRSPEILSGRRRSPAKKGSRFEKAIERWLQDSGFDATKTSRPAKSNDPSTWGTYAEAVAAVAAGMADGIGYTLFNGELAAIDLDHCRDRDSGAEASWATNLLAEANVTVSGQGLRLIGTAHGSKLHRRFAFDRKSGAGVELYRGPERYITISGLENGECHGLPPIDNLIDTIFTRHTALVPASEAERLLSGEEK